MKKFEYTESVDIGYVDIEYTIKLTNEEFNKVKFFSADDFKQFMLKNSDKIESRIVDASSMPNFPKNVTLNDFDEF